MTGTGRVARPRRSTSARATFLALVVALALPAAWPWSRASVATADPAGQRETHSFGASYASASYAPSTEPVPVADADADATVPVPVPWTGGGEDLGSRARAAAMARAALEAYADKDHPLTERTWPQQLRRLLAPPVRASGAGVDPPTPAVGRVLRVDVPPAEEADLLLCRVTTTDGRWTVLLSRAPTPAQWQVERIRPQPGAAS